MSQLAQIQKCFGDLYCKVEQMRCVGRNTSKEQLLLDKLYIAYWISCGSDCDIECFLQKNCAHCKPTKNVLPVADCCGVTDWLYVDSFEASSQSIVSVVNSGTLLYDVVISQMAFTTATTSPIASSTTNIVDLNTGGAIYTGNNPIPASVTVQASGVSIGTSLVKIPIAVIFTVKNEDGLTINKQMLFDIYFHEFHSESSTFIVNSKITGPVSLSKSCTSATWTSLGDDSDNTTSVLASPLTNASNTNIDLSGVSMGFLSNGIAESCMFWANCSDTHYSSIPQAVFDCSDGGQLGLSYVNLGYSSSEVIYVESSIDGGLNWAVVLQLLGNGTNRFIDPNYIAWDKTDYPEGTSVDFRIRTTTYGVVAELNGIVAPICP